jgi:hypothetical protein
MGEIRRVTGREVLSPGHAGLEPFTIPPCLIPPTTDDVTDGSLYRCPWF